jgi:hypothetical protein
LNVHSCVKIQLLKKSILRYMTEKHDNESRVLIYAYIGEVPIAFIRYQSVHFFSNDIIFLSTHTQFHLDERNMLKQVRKLIVFFLNAQRV